MTEESSVKLLCRGNGALRVTCSSAIGNSMGQKVGNHGFV